MDTKKDGDIQMSPKKVLYENMQPQPSYVYTEKYVRSLRGEIYSLRTDNNKLRAELRAELNPSEEE